ncbi:probable calcium-binding protein CML46 [Gastrolobium bilobum]|uniref:probable calcium-binding protein CML46 n=1 Tax=Gastrolobium bilobum TaxID=150636 RepID=UPI002AAF4615|nr:probable calcium-binding protein CML46 [Gastrolobium bilobum]
MVLSHLDYLIAEKKTSQNDGNSTSPLCGLVDLVIYLTFFHKIREIISGFLFFLLQKLHSGNSKVSGEEEQVAESEFSHQENESNGSRESEKLERDEVKMVMEKLGFFCSSESEELQETYGSKELSELFEEHEPSLEEVKQAFDVFDENKDGFIDARELQRVLCILGLKEAKELENCQKMIMNFDENQDGRIDFIEFVKIMENRFC